jgi:hypothetical protein
VSAKLRRQNRKLRLAARATVTFVNAFLKDADAPETQALYLIYFMRHEWACAHVSLAKRQVIYDIARRRYGKDI